MRDGFVACLDDVRLRTSLEKKVDDDFGEDGFSFPNQKFVAGRDGSFVRNVGRASDERDLAAKNTDLLDVQLFCCMSLGISSES